MEPHSALGQEGQFPQFQSQEEQQYIQQQHLEAQHQAQLQQQHLLQQQQHARDSTAATTTAEHKLKSRSRHRDDGRKPSSNGRKSKPSY